MFSKEDIEQIKVKGISPETIEKQLEIFRKGAKHIKLYRSAVFMQDISDILSKDAVAMEPEFKVLSFIPASGAATRMFDNLYKTLAAINDVGEENFILKIDNDHQSAFTFFNNIKKFAFFDELDECLKKDGLNINELLKKNKYKIILEYILGNKGLNFGSKPKALIPFHKEKDRLKCAYEEHITEAAKYTKGKDIYLHFTLSPEHLNEFNENFFKIKDYYENQLDKKIHVETSIQSPSTDTIAVNPDNTLFRNSDNSLLFRPGGHGALIHNLNELDADFILIKNIDNVVPDSRKSLIIRTRLKMMDDFAQFCALRNEALHILENAIENKKEINLTLPESIAVTVLKLFPPDNYDTLEYNEKLNVLYNLLNRPIRVCGVVKNEGEPGGGPFVTYDNDKLSMQIVEKSQIDINNPDQVKIFESSKYFNPVDIICCTKNHKAEKYNLEIYIDHDAGFISNKTKDGKPLKALELPGLWNGAMSNWITIFVEVPIETFNPVKTVNDLLRPSHQ
ncbi:MAG: DUF4301 family protein [Bacteroidales bacterium]|jgi:hypothetical protein|nr:DUF4301 family protein [Bacteroidales bacterium]